MATTEAQQPVPTVRDNQRLSYEQLRAEAQAAASRYEGRQEDLAAELGVGRSWLSRALNESGSKFVGLQRRVIEHLTDFTVSEEPEVTYRAIKKGGRPSEQ